MKSFYFLLLFITNWYSVFNSSDPYYQIVDKYSFNLKNKNDVNKLYKNFKREGDSVFYDNNIMLTPKKNNTYGLIYTKDEIISESLEFQLSFKINNSKAKGSSLAIWFFKDQFHSHVAKDRSLVGFSNNFDGIAVYLMTPPKETIEAKTFIFTAKNKEGEVLTSPGFKTISGYNSCNENFHGRTVKVTIKLHVKEKNLSIKYNTQDSLIYPCMDYIHIDTFQPPYRIGVSSYNGIIEGEQYLDNIQIEKFTVFNMDENLKDKYIYEAEPEDNDINNSDKEYDLIREYNGKQEESSNSHENSYKVLITQLDSIINNLMEIEKLTSIEGNKNDIENFVLDVKNKFSHLKNKFVNNNKSNSTNRESFVDDKEYSTLVQELEILKKEWESATVRTKLSEGLNTMLSDKINNLLGALNKTEGMHLILAGKLVNYFILQFLI